MNKEIPTFSDTFNFRFGQPVRLQIAGRSQYEQELLSEHLELDIVNIQLFDTVNSNGQRLLITRSSLEIEPIKIMFKHEIPDVQGDNAYFKTLLLSNIARLKRLFGDRCVEQFFLGHFLAAIPNQGFVMQYKAYGASGSVMSFMNINSRRNAFVLNLAAPGSLEDPKITLEQLFLERFWRNNLIDAGVRKVFVYNLEISQRFTYFSVLNHGWIQIHREVPFSGGF